MDAITYILKNISFAWPSLLMGAVIPCTILLVLLLRKDHNEVPFVTVAYGFLAFVGVFVFVAVILMILFATVIPTITIQQESDSTNIIRWGGSVVLLLFYVLAELVKQFCFISYDQAAEKNRFVGLSYASGFILGQNLLILGVIYVSNVDMKQTLAFGVLMIISGMIYTVVSEIGYQLIREKHRYVGVALSGSYYLMFMVMLIFANIYATYFFVFAVLIFNLVMAYVLLPLPFKKKGEAIS